MCSLYFGISFLLIGDFCIIQIHLREVTLCSLTISSPHILSSIHFNAVLFANTIVRLLLLSSPSNTILPNSVFVSSILILIDFTASFDTADNTTVSYSSFSYAILGPWAHRIELICSTLVSHYHHSSQLVQSLFLFIYFYLSLWWANNGLPKVSPF